MRPARIAILQPVKTIKHRGPDGCLRVFERRRRVAQPRGSGAQRLGAVDRGPVQKHALLRLGAPLKGRKLNMGAGQGEKGRLHLGVVQCRRRAIKLLAIFAGVHGPRNIEGEDERKTTLALGRGGRGRRKKKAESKPRRPADRPEEPDCSGFSRAVPHYLGSPARAVRRGRTSGRASPKTRSLISR